MLDSTFVAPAQEPHDPEARIAALEAELTNARYDLAAQRNLITLLDREARQREAALLEARALLDDARAIVAASLAVETAHAGNVVQLVDEHRAASLAATPRLRAWAVE
jgi:hypothetical protein